MAPSGPTMATIGVQAGELKPRCVYQKPQKCIFVPAGCSSGACTMMVSRVTLPSHFQSGEPAPGAVSPTNENSVQPAALTARPRRVPEASRIFKVMLCPNTDFTVMSGAAAGAGRGAG